MGFTGRTYTVNPDFFKIWSSDMAYILGFIASDGNITNNQLRLRIKSEDSDLLEQIREKMGFSGEIKVESVRLKDNIYYSANLIISCKEIVDDLKSLGITENKSLTISFPESIPNEFVIDYIRGYFDGDGSIGIQYPTNGDGKKTRSAQLRTRIVSGSKDMVDKTNFHLHHRIGTKLVTVSKDKRKTLYEVCYSTKDSLVIYQSFYNDKCVYLKRKRDKFEEGIILRKESTTFKKIK